MKTRLIVIIGLLINCLVFGQDSILVNQKTRLIALTPLKDEITTVNGLTLGLGLDPKFNFKGTGHGNFQKVNGINLDVNPLGLLIWMFYDPSKSEKSEFIKVNGLTISAAGYLRGVSHQGLNISMYNYGHTMNGVMVSALYTDIEKGKGIFISGLLISAIEMKGLSISAANDTEMLKGIQIGIYNKAIKANGLQIGLINKSNKIRGLQLGLWNKNDKRSLPLINF
ncbi:hypothetical protein [Chryseobacterium sp. ERMR1:04]|uniref:LA_2272 family surface repeat-containing protein n=1 Tax=Chryseobacterium sp. ERMR1:04 TaxID=1705393 RepID=UPI0006C8572A|nr:hypothetical protein [Chryseobacterium sp. ERMR1:04]KPH13724.1 hypothetical protein AMQ68_09275 [Chryseobacterium sp. ERMR1:04]